MEMLPRLGLDIAVPPEVLTKRRGGVTVPRRIFHIIARRAATEITVDSAGQNAVFVRISEDASLPASGTSPSAASTFASCSPAEVETTPGDPPPRLLSGNDRLLIENLNVGHCRARHTGRFLTMHKRRRKRLSTRSLNQEPALLDDIFHGQVKCVLQKANNWRFNAFTLETVTGGRSLPVLCVHLFQTYGLFRKFNLDVVRVWKLFALIEEGYHSTNPYHNSIHATDVTQAMHCFLQEEKIKRHLSSLEIMASLIAAVTHDLDHPGVNQPFLVATSNHLATLYENTSVLENHHWRSAIGCLLESGVSEQLPAEVRPELQRHISSLILATDITRQQEFLTRFKSSLDNNTLDMKRPENRHFILQISLKCADISNPCRPWDISRKWSYKVCEEFFRQGDYERQLSLPVTPLCDRQSISIPRIQAGFFEFVVTPLYEEWHRFLGDGLSVSLMLHLRANQKRWESLVARENADETRAETLDLEKMQNSSISDDEQITGDRRDDSGSVDILLPDVSSSAAAAGGGGGGGGGGAEEENIERQSSLSGELGRRRFNRRRHSVPLSVTKPLSILPMIEDSRRESLPIERVKTTRNPLFLLEDTETGIEALHELSSLSLLSSRSSVYESAGNGSSSCERPVSAENLLPETSIASITSSVEATRLSSVLQPDNVKSSVQTKYLTRQQTFPPLQPYVRIRYMSTTAEMSKYRTETLMEADDDTPSNSEQRNIIEKTGKDKCSSCSSSLCSVTDCESSRHYQRECCSNNRCSKKPEFSSTDTTRNNLDVSSSFNDFPRRHSIQAVRNEDSSLICSAQEAYPAQMFCASLIGGAKLNKNHNNSESRNETENNDCPSRVSVKSNNSHKRESSACSSNVILPTDKPRVSNSTPTTDTRTTSVDCAVINVVRRFTAIPVTSELPARKFFIGSPPGSPPRLHSVSSSSDSGSDQRSSVGYCGNETLSIGAKRDSDSSRQKSSKIRKLSDDGRMKENLDPRIVDDFNMSSIAFARRTNQGWARRRGSAPVGLLARLDDSAISAAAVTPRTDRHSMRRGSVPTDVIGNQTGGSLRAALGPRGENVPLPRRASLPQEAALSNLLGNVLLPADERENFPANNNNNNNSNNNNNNNSGTHTSGNNNGSSRVTESIAVTGTMSSPRRGSVPADISELRRDLFGRNSVNGRTRNRKKTLRRRSSGGPEMFSGRNVGEDNDNGKSGVWKRDMTKRDSIPGPSVNQRGSLPVETVSIFHPGSAAGTRRSSLWRL